MDVQLIQRGENFFITFENYVPDSGQILMNNGESPARKNDHGDFEFEFEDNWGSKGKGSLRQDGDNATVTVQQVQITSDPWGRNAGRQYGRYQLTKSACIKQS